MVELDVIIKEFVAESGEMLDRLEQDLIALEREPSSPDTLASLFRSLHTIKGAAGFMGLEKLGALAHSGESVLSRLRDGTLAITPAIAGGLLALSDCLRTMLSHVDRTGIEGDIDGAAIVESLERLQDHTPISATAVAPPVLAPADAAPEPASNGHVRVSVGRLDALVNLVGELVIARNAIVRLAGGDGYSALLIPSQRLHAITAQLQEQIMTTRMQPIDHVWSKLPRVVRDAAQQCGKRVRLEMNGRETALDRTLIEAIQAPLTHVVRNCVDHGLETPEQRLAAGKAVEGHLSLRAFHEGGLVTIEVADDGAGVDVAAITRKALERGLVTPEQARGMSEQDAIDLIFLPGLSTAAAVTSLSGRGVGMDVVRTNIEQIGGKVSIHSEPGAGTTVRMRIPLTLAIMTAVLVADGEQCYAIPQANVAEFVRVEADTVADTIDMTGDTAVFDLRGERLPLVGLHAQLTAAPESGSSGSPIAAAGATIVVLQADGRQFGLIVDAVNDTQEIVVKPLGRYLRGTAVFAGATIMGDGQVALILDVAALAANARLRFELRGTDAPRARFAKDEISEPMESLLLCAATDDMRIAFPLSQIARLELFPWSSRPFQTLVHATGGREKAVVVDSILDTVEERAAMVRPDGIGLAGSIVIDGRLTQLVDLDLLCANAARLAAGAGDGKAA